MNVYTDALRDRVAENLGDFGGTIYNVANGALLDQAFNMGIGSVAQNVLKNQLYTIFDATDSGNPLLDAFHANLKTNTADYVLDKGISYL